jgi:hypothetical protein
MDSVQRRIVIGLLDQQLLQTFRESNHNIGIPVSGLRFMQRWLWRLLSSGVWRRVAW